MAPTPSRHATPAPSSRHSTPKASSRPATPTRPAIPDRHILLPEDLDQTDLNKLMAKKVDFIAVTGVESDIRHSTEEHLREKKRLLHWRVHASWFLDNNEDKALVKRKSASVIFDTSKTDVNATNDVWIEYKSNFTFSNKSPSNARWSGKTKKDITVQDIWNLIEEKKRQYYHYDGNGSGCLYWSKTLLGDFEGQKWVDEGAVKALEQIVDGLRGERGKYWVPNDKGTFFKQ
ncbi:hypothetical protein DFH11DRAFT_809105 [Phellopilus nigrolimitatus]|nr:hypothetical protein DFH11DRAFT_809105 [Phellopilus nigrolimitatus]